MSVLSLKPGKGLEPASDLAAKAGASRWVRSPGVTPRRRLNVLAASRSALAVQTVPPDATSRDCIPEAVRPVSSPARQHHDERLTALQVSARRGWNGPGMTGGGESRRKVIHSIVGRTVVFTPSNPEARRTSVATL